MQIRGTLLILFSLLSLVSFSQNKEKKVKSTDVLIINGSVKNLKNNPVYIYVRYADGNGIDSTKVIDGRYHFELKTNATTRVALFNQNPKNPKAYSLQNIFVFISEPTQVSVNSIGSFSNTFVAGSYVYREIKAIKTKTLKFQKKIQTLEDSSISANKRDEVSAKIDALKSASYAVYTTYINRHPHSPLLNYLLYVMTNESNNADYTFIEKKYNQLTKEEKYAYFGRRISKKIASSKINIGIEAPQFTLADSSGNRISLSAFKGKYVLLDFWASWCTPCRAQSPYLVKAYKKYKNKGFEIISISLDKKENRKDWINAINKDSLVWTNLIDDKNSKVHKQYRVIGIPQNFLINPMGKIVGKNLFGEALERQLKSFF